MNLVFQKARELGDALLQSDEYKAMRQMEERSMANPEAALTMGRYMQIKQQIEKLLISEDPDADTLRNLSAQMDSLQAHLQLIDDIEALTDARNQFTKLIDQVNSVLKFIITGEMDDPDKKGCGGAGCTDCPGCGHPHVH